MGLDQYMYTASKEGTNYDDPSRRELGYRRKHPNLQGYMEALWAKRNPNDVEHISFNGVELELTWDDLEDLEKAINEGLLPQTTGFFFGEDSDEYYKQQDLDFIKKAKTEIFCGFKVFYNSSW